MKSPQNWITIRTWIFPVDKIYMRTVHTEIFWQSSGIQWLLLLIYEHFVCFKWWTIGWESFPLYSTHTKIKSNFLSSTPACFFSCFLWKLAILKAVCVVTASSYTRGDAPLTQWAKLQMPSLFSWLPVGVSFFSGCCLASSNNIILAVCLLRMFCCFFPPRFWFTCCYSAA